VPNVSHTLLWTAVFVLLIELPSAALGQMEFFESPYGIDPTQMNGSCDVCQQASGEPDWFNSAYGGFEADGLDSQCGCEDLSSMGMPAFADSGDSQQFGMEPYGCDSCAMTPNMYGYAAPMGFPSACNQCDSCAPVGCAAPAFGCQTCCPCGNAAPIWLGAEALIWSTSSTSLPPLVTTSENGTQQLDAGVIGRPATQVLYGGNNIFNGMHGGFRLRGGVNFDQCGVSGMDAEFFMLGTRQESYHADSIGDPILARPFLNAATGLNDSQLVAFPDLASGTIDIATRSRLNSAAIHYREVFWKECDPGSPCQDDCWRSGPRSFSLGFQMGPRFVNLRDSFSVSERLTGIETGDVYQIQDSFRTRNQFLGCEPGLFGTHQRRRWSLDGGVRLGIGVTRQQLNVSGQTVVTQSGVTTTSPGGFLAQRTNSGSWEHNRFTLLPQFDVGLGYQMTNTWRASVGYSLMYWGNVLRATEQIDPVINPGLLPPEQNPLTGPLRPAPLLHESSYLAHGITIGLERRW